MARYQQAGREHEPDKTRYDVGHMHPGGNSWGHPDEECRKEKAGEAWNNHHKRDFIDVGLVIGNIFMFTDFIEERVDDHLAKPDLAQRPERQRAPHDQIQVFVRHCLIRLVAFTRGW